MPPILLGVARPGTEPDRRWDGLVLALTLGAALLVASRFVDYAYDDAYITYRYAKNILAGHGFVYNLEHNYLGTTTPLYTLLLAALGWIAEIPKASGFLSVASLVSSIALLELIGRQAQIRFAGVAAGLFLVLNPEVYRIFGGETLFVYFLLVPLGFYLHQRGDETAGALVFGLAILARMDAALFVAIVYADALIRRRALPIKQVLVIAATLSPWLLYSLIVFDRPLPSTLWTKMALGASGQWELFFDGSLRYLGRLPEYAHWTRWIFLPLLALGLVRCAVVERVWLYFVAQTVLFGLAYQLVLRVSFSHWYLANVLLTNAILLGAGVRQLLALCPPGTSWLSRMAPRAILLVGLGAYLSYASQAILDFEIHPARRQLYTRLGKWLYAHTEPSATVAYHEIGYVGYFSERTIIDRVGLVTPGGLESIRRGDGSWAFRRYKPDYYVVNTRFGTPRRLSFPAFQRRYELVGELTQKGYRGDVLIFRRR